MIMNKTDNEGNPLKTEWSPYEPRILDEIDKEITLKCLRPTKEALHEFFTSRIYGYTKSIAKYLKQDPELLKEELDEWMCHEDEITFLHWMWRLLVHFDNYGENVAWQMPEDVVKSFTITGDVQDDILSSKDLIFYDGCLTVNSIHHHAINKQHELTTYNIFSLKAITAYMLMILTAKLSQDTDEEMTVSYSNLCDAYVQGINNYESAMPKISSDEGCITKYLSTGKIINLTYIYVNVDEFISTTISTISGESHGKKKAV